MTSLWAYLVLLLLAFCAAPWRSASSTYGIPIPSLVVPAIFDTKTRVERDIEVPPPEILRFMRRFGYLDSNPSNSEALYHESAIVEAIKNIQKYGALPQTGKLDNKTLELFNKPRCGVPDIEGIPYYLASTTQRSYASPQRIRSKRFVVGAPTWTKRNLRYFIANWSLKIPHEQVERDIARALALWAQYGGLHFERVNDTAADIIFGFGARYHGDSYPFDGPGNILAHAFYPYEMGSWGGDVHFDEDENWQENSTELSNGVDFYAVAVHELGHSLGLAHSPHYASVMFPYYKGPGASSTLDYDDTLAMYEIYLNKHLEDDDLSYEKIDFEESLPTTVVSMTTSIKGTIKPTFHGDYETITQHKSRYNFNTAPTILSEISSTPKYTTTTGQKMWPKSELSEIPDICRGKFDAVSVLNGSVYIFKNEYVYKLTPRYTLMNGYPLTIYEIFPFLPTYIKHIDAAYQRYDGSGVFFTGQQYWVFSYNHTATPVLIEGSPLPLVSLLNETAHVDAAMLWPKNNCTYIFSGAKFWRYNDRLRALDIGYPKSMRRWPGIPNFIDAAATLPNGKTYFFKNNIYWLYDNANVRPERGYPRRASTAWLGCSVPPRTPLRNFNTTVSFIVASSLSQALASP